jgi:hypothetical protein
MGRDLLLDYAFPIEAIEALAEPSKAYLNRVCVIAKPKSGQEANVGTIFQCLSMAEVAVRTNNTNAQQLFNAGLTQCYVLLANNLDLATYLATAKTFFTVLISDDFDKDAITIYQADGIATISAFAALVAGTADTLTVGEIVFTAQATSAVLGEATFQSATSNEATASSLATQINAHNGTKNLVIATAVGAVLTIKAKNSGSAGNNIVLAYNSNGSVGLVLSGITAGKLDGGAGLFVGTWNGVVGVSSDNLAFLEAQAVITKRTAFFGNATNGAKSMFFAFGKLLAGATWRNQQYVEMPVNDGIDTIAEAMNLFDSKISFVLNSIQYGNRLALFTNNRKAIVAPYLSELFQLMMQGWGVGYIALNQPAYTILQASLLEDYLAGEADKTFVQTNLIENISVQISLVRNNFTASGNLQIAEPKALWRVNSLLTETA